MSDPSSDPSASSPGLEIQSRPNGDVLVAVAWFLEATTVLTLISRLFTKYSLSRKIHNDDIAALMSLFLSLSLTISVTLQGQNGYQGPDQTQSADQLVALLKSTYASSLLFILTVGASNLSVSFFLADLSPHTSHKMINRLLAGFISVWTVASVFAYAFSCSPPRPWDVLSSQCFQRTTFWYVFGGIQILVDLMLVVAPAIMILPLNMPKTKRILMLCTFACRVLNIAAIGLQMNFTGTLDASRFVTDSWMWSLTTQVVACLTIIFSCIPYIRQLLAAFPSGMMMSDEIRRKTANGTMAGGNSSVEASRKSYVLKPVQSRRQTTILTTNHENTSEEMDFGFSSIGTMTTVMASDGAASDIDQKALIPEHAKADSVIVTTTFSTVSS